MTDRPISKATLRQRADEVWAHLAYADEMLRNVRSALSEAPEVEVNEAIAHALMALAKGAML